MRDQGSGKATEDTSSPAEILCSIQVRDSFLSTWLIFSCSQVLKLSSQLKTGHLPFQGAETMSKILRTRIVKSWIDKHSLRRWLVIQILIANVSEVDTVFFKNIIQSLRGDVGCYPSHLLPLSTMHDKLQDM